jgi:shikimate kinase
MRKTLVMISGLRGRGKTTLGRGLAPVLNPPLIDKDDILEQRRSV